MDSSVDYKEMYFKMVRASEAAVRALIQAQEECEELYLSAEGQHTTNIVLEPIESNERIHATPTL